ncbi:prolyl oligopeptidase family serine peptidase [bacterium]|nr:prolyl oligopeptidase family serine peptidase [bacterium]
MSLHVFRFSQFFENRYNGNYYPLKTHRPFRSLVYQIIQTSPISEGRPKAHLRSILPAAIAVLFNFETLNSLMNKFLVLLICLAPILKLQAQDKKLLTIEDVSVNYSLYPRELSQIQWIPESDWYAFAKDEVMMVKEASGKDKFSFSLQDMNAALPEGVDKLKHLPGITFQSTAVFTFSHNNAYYKANTSGDLKFELLFKTEPEAANVEFDVESGNYSYTVNDDLYVNGKKINTTEKGIAYGQTVHRNEFGIYKGTFWSKDYEKMAFYKNDQRAVSDYPLLDITKPVAEVNMIKYPMAGQANEVVRLGVYNVADGNTVYMQTGDADQYLTNISWDPNGKYIYIGVLNRDQNHLQWQKYDASSGKLIKTLFEEKSESFVEPLNVLYFNPKAENEFLWTTWRDGFTHLYRYNTDGQLLNQVTNGAFEVTDFVGFDESGKYIYYLSTEESPLERQLYRISVKGGKASRITEARGQHFIRMSDKGNYIIDSYSSRFVAREMLMLSSKGKEMHKLLQVEDPLNAYVKTGVEFGTIKAADGQTELYYRIIKPHDFDPSKKYPVIQYVYGGPHAQMIGETWMGNASLFLHYLAQQGYIVFTVDGRGSDNRGAAFEQATFRQLGTLEIADQLAGLEFIKSQHYVDNERIGVHGWSFGGFMTTGLMLRAPGAFKVGVCGGPVIDWKYYEIMYTERYMDTPQDNPDGYKTASLLNYVENLQGKLLIVQGADDDVVVWQHSLVFIDECVSKAVLFDYFPYPGHKHHVRGNDRIHLQKYMAQYFMDNL